MQYEYFLGIDIGTSSIKAVVFDTTGRQVASAYRKCDEIHEINADDVLQNTIMAICDCLEKSNIDKKALVAAGMSCHMHSLLLLDQHEKPLSKVLTWADTRATEESKYIVENCDVVSMYRETGCRVQHPMYPLSKILWYKNQKRDLFRRACRFVTIKEYILYKLYGEFVVDYTLAASQGYFNIHQQDWADDILAILEIDRKTLSPPVDCFYMLTGMKPEYAKAIGTEIPMIIGTGDGIAANLGCGACDSQFIASTVGTSGAIRVATNKPMLDERQGLWCYSISDKLWMSGGAINNGGLVLRWLKDNFRNLEHPTKSPFEQCNSYAQEVPPGADGLIFLPNLTGERSPDWNHNAPGVMFGLTYKHNFKHIVRAAMEGVMYRLYWVYRTLASSLGQHYLIASGGYTKSPVWLQMQADIFGKKILLSQIEEASALGAAFLAMVATARQSKITDRLPAMENTIPIEPRHEYSEMYKNTWQFSKKLYSSISELNRHRSKTSIIR